MTQHLLQRKEEEKEMQCQPSRPHARAENQDKPKSCTVNDIPRRADMPVIKQNFGAIF